MADIIAKFVSPVDTRKPVEFLKTGVFVDANGQRVEFDEEFLDDLIRNFEGGSAGQDVPFDILHKREEAAGWVSAVRRNGNKLIAIPDWNDLGMSLVKDRIYRYLSATINLTKRTLLSISLVNFPAVKGLLPVELAERDGAPAEFFESDSVDAFLHRVRVEFYRFLKDVLGTEGRDDEATDAVWAYQIIEIFNTYLIVKWDEKLYVVDFVVSNNEIGFSPMSAWVLVKRGYLAADNAEVPDNQFMEDVSMSEVTPLEGAQEDNSPQAEELSQDQTVDVTLAVLEAETEGEVEAELEAEPEPEVELQEEPRAETVDELGEPEDGTELSEPIAPEVTDVLTDVRAQLSDLVRSELPNMIAELRQQIRDEVTAEAQIVEFSQRVTCTGQYALPVSPNQVEGALKRLGVEDRKAVMGLLQAIHDNGTVSFVEKGTAEGATPVELAEYQEEVEQGLKLWLRHNDSIDAFFSANPQYDKTKLNLTNLVEDQHD